METIRKTAAMLCCVCLLAAMSATALPVSAAATEYLLTQHTDKYKTQGRVLLTSECLMVDWTASGIEFEANCEGDVYVKFQVDAVDAREKQGCYFTIVVDGVTESRTKCHITQTGEQFVKIASGLAAGKHTFAIYRQTETRPGNKIGIRSIRLSGELLSAPAKSEMYIEFVGDSVTTAYGNLVALGGGAGEALYQDGTQGYAYLTAKKLGADHSVVAIEGIGASVGWTNFTMQQVYPKLRYRQDANTNYDFARRPDVVVLALGTNDINRYSANGKTLADVKKGFADMLSLVRTKNPGAKVVWIHGMMTGGADSLIKEVISEAGGETAGLYTLSMTRDTSGGNGHPSVWAHQENATKLAAFIRSTVLPDTTTTTTTKKTTTTTSTTKKTTTTTSTTKKTTTTKLTTTTTTTASQSTGSSTASSGGNGGLNPLHTLPPLPSKTTVSLEPTKTAEATTAPIGGLDTTTPPSESETESVATTTTGTTITTVPSEADSGAPVEENDNSVILIVVIAVGAVVGVAAILVFRRKK